LLEVSSPGLDRKLVGPADYERFIGSLVKLTTREPVNGNQHFEGRLQSFQDGWLTLDLNLGKKKKKNAPELPELKLQFGNVEKANLVPEI